MGSEEGLLLRMWLWLLERSVSAGTPGPETTEGGRGCGTCTPSNISPPVIYFFTYGIRLCKNKTSDWLMSWAAQGVTKFPPVPPGAAILPWTPRTSPCFSRPCRLAPRQSLLVLAVSSASHEAPWGEAGRTDGCLSRETVQINPSVFRRSQTEGYAPPN